MGDKAIVGGAALRAEHGELLVFLPHIHFLTHKGFIHQCEYLNAALANAGNLDLVITTGAKEVHLGQFAQAGGQCNLYLYEDPTVSGGTALTLFNMRRSSALTPLSSVVHTPTVTSVGSKPLIPGRLLPGGASAQTRTGGEARSDAEWILKPSSKYLLRLTNTSGGTIAASMALAFYEHDEEA